MKSYREFTGEINEGYNDITLPQVTKAVNLITTLTAQQKEYFFKTLNFVVKQIQTKKVPLEKGNPMGANPAMGNMSVRPQDMTTWGQNLGG